MGFTGKKNSSKRTRARLSRATKPWRFRDAPSTALNAILTLQDAPESAVNDLNVSDWIKESFDAPKQTSDKSPPIGAGAGPFTLTMAYKTLARSVAEKRIALAGARLAKMLNEELK